MLSTCLLNISNYKLRLLSLLNLYRYFSRMLNYIHQLHEFDIRDLSPGPAYEERKARNLRAKASYLAAPSMPGRQPKCQTAIAARPQQSPTPPRPNRLVPLSLPRSEPMTTGEPPPSVSGDGFLRAWRFAPMLLTAPLPQPLDLPSQFCS